MDHCDLNLSFDRVLRISVGGKNILPVFQGYIKWLYFEMPKHFMVPRLQGLGYLRLMK